MIIEASRRFELNSAGLRDRKRSLDDRDGGNLVEIVQCDPRRVIDRSVLFHDLWLPARCAAKDEANCVHGGSPCGLTERFTVDPSEFERVEQETGLLVDLSHEGGFRMFAPIDATAWKRPVAFQWNARSDVCQKNLTVVDSDRIGRHPRSL